MRAPIALSGKANRILADRASEKDLEENAVSAHTSTDWTPDLAMAVGFR